MLPVLQKIGSRFGKVRQVIILVPQCAELEFYHTDIHTQLHCKLVVRRNIGVGFIKIPDLFFFKSHLCAVSFVLRNMLVDVLYNFLILTIVDFFEDELVGNTQVCTS